MKNVLNLLSSISCLCVCFMVMLPAVRSECTNTGCSKACNYMCLNANQSGSCNSNYRNLLLRNDPSCVCDGCPAVTMCDLARTAELAQNGTCIGPPFSYGLCSPLGCPVGPLNNFRFPHICNVDGKKLCVCMCAGLTETIGLATCPIKGLLSWWPW